MANEKKESIWSKPIGGGGGKKEKAPKAPKAPKDPKATKESKSSGGQKQSIFSKPLGGGKSAKGGGKAGRGKMPTKTSINLVINEKKSVHPAKAIIFTVIIILAAGAFSKFMVIDRLTAMSQATGRVSQLRSSLSATEAAIADLSDIQEVYAHYTYSGMSPEELGLVDRVAVLELADTVFESGGESDSWQLTGNTLTAEVKGKTLEELNELAQFVQTFPIVDRCAITMANKTTNKGKDVDVRASFIIYLQQPAEEEEGEQS